MNQSLPWIVLCSSVSNDCLVFFLCLCCCFRNLHLYWVENGYTAGYTLFHVPGEVGVPSIHSSDQRRDNFLGMGLSTQLSIYFKKGY